MVLSELIEVLSPTTRIVVQVSVDHTQPCDAIDFPEEHPKSWDLLKNAEVGEVWYNDIYTSLWIELNPDFAYCETWGRNYRRDFKYGI